MSDRQKAMQFLANSVKSAFTKGLKATVGGFDYQFMDKGQEIQVGDHVMRTTESGIFQKTPVLVPNPQTNKHEFSHHTFLHYGHTDQLSDILDHLCRDMSVHEIEMTMVGVSSYTALSSQSRNRKLASEETLSI